MEFGYSDSQKQFDDCVQWRKDAVADGWEIKPTYGDHESVESAAELKRDGFVALVLTRLNRGKWKFEAIVNLWAPDRRHMATTFPYSWQAIKSAFDKCHHEMDAGKNVGRCLTEYKCKKCGMVEVIDSSD